jgi:succinate dehydrogenase/fumarate reductase iron-sulfur protein
MRRFAGRIAMSREPHCQLTTKDMSVLEDMLDRCSSRDGPLAALIQRKLDATLAYRYACRVGMCGSCAMTVNGVARWTCRTHVGAVADEGSRLRIAPLANLPVIRDLATDMREFFNKWTRAKGYYKGSRRG